MMKTKLSKSYNFSNGNFEETQVEVVVIEKIPEKSSTRGRLMSRLPQPATISYKGESTIIPAQGISRPLDSRFLGALPKGVIFVRLKD